MTVETGGWLGGRPVLISPISIVNVDWTAKRLDVALTKKQVENSPCIDTLQPVSRQHEAEYMGYYGYPFYWGGPDRWGPAFYPAGLAAPLIPSVEAIADRTGCESADSHLRSSEAAAGYSIAAIDGEIGHLDGFWSTIRLGQSDTSKWPLGTGGRGKKCWYLPRG